MRTLMLTSPRLTGEDVGRAQFILNGNNVYQQDYLQGPIDHVWGELSSQAAYRARYWTGASLADLAKYQGRYGDVLDGILTGRIEPTPAMKTLRTKRLAAAQTTPLREKALAEARKYVGYCESPPGSNHNQFGKAYGFDGVPWCAIFVSECYLAAGSKAFARAASGNRWAYCPYIESTARAGQNFLSVTTNPQPGDLVLYDWGHDGVADHVAFFVEGSPTAEFVDLGGNTSPTDASNGGTVAIQHRRASDVRLFVHVGS